jgi:[ribosomal protein S18]-alanine N-acetyltransferase
MTAPSESVTVGALTVDDAERCAELEALLFPGDDPWPTAAFVRELAAAHNHYVAARISADDAEMLIGYGGISRLGRTPPFEYEIHTIGVDPAYQGRGIGRWLLDELLNIADGAVVHLEVRTDNEPALALYRSVGFAEVGVRPRYYRISGADAFTMRREARADDNKEMSDEVGVPPACGGERRQ